ncbi:MAG: hypothetical protein BGO43_13405 [Gammaproteobacteria bacterium 39-13]|nr:hypothetical protein [Gammaproteobacteria bacterium]OJV85722.1 MAG: hypothetical protein BGO43_13405 [Gammaproteobacteria bacterium 39-13]
MLIRNMALFILILTSFNLYAAKVDPNAAVLGPASTAEVSPKSNNNPSSSDNPGAQYGGANPNGIRTYGSSNLRQPSHESEGQIITNTDNNPRNRPHSSANAPTTPPTVKREQQDFLNSRDTTTNNGTYQ